MEANTSEHSASGSRSSSVGKTLSAELTSPTVSAAEEPVVIIPPPEASPQALEYVQSAVAHVDLISLMFEDQLVTVSDTGKELGTYSVTMAAIRRNAQLCYLIHASSRGSVDGVPCGNSIVCYLSPAMETLEQHHHEFVKLERDALDRKTVIKKGPEGYVVNKVVTRGTESTSTSRTFPLDTMKGFISEGSNLLLHRIFIVHGLPEELQFISLDSEDNLCPSVYRSMEPRPQKVDGKEMEVVGVERTVDSEVDMPITWQSYFTSEGFLSNRVQVGSPVTMTLQQIPVKKIWDVLPKPVFEKKELIWEEDAHMYSAFLDRKDELKNSHEVFVRHHPELRTLLADFLQFLLLGKPQDVLAFSADYFAPFSRNPGVTTKAPKYLASAIPPLFPHCRTNEKIQDLRTVTAEKH